MNFLPVTYLVSYVLSLFGNSIAGIALPLIVLQATGSALGAGAVAAATALPAVLAGLFMGVVIDRINRRTSSVVTDLISAAAIAALPLVDMVSGLSLGWFILFGVIGSFGDVPGMTAREALLPAIVQHGGMSAERLMGVRESLSAVAVLVGPAAAGTLLVLCEEATVLWITAATSLLAALITMLIPRYVGTVTPDESLPAERPSGTGWSQLRDGWRVLFKSRFLITITMVSLMSVLVLAALQGLILPVYFTSVGQPGLLGFVLSALALGMLIGGGVYAVFGMRGQRRAWFVAGLGGMTLGIALITLLVSPGAVFVGAFVIGLASGLFGSLVGVLMIERIPEAMRGRIMGTQNAMMTAAPPVGIVLAAFVTEYLSVNAAALMLFVVWGCTFVGCVFTRSLRKMEPEASGRVVGES